MPTVAPTAVLSSEQRENLRDILRQQGIDNWVDGAKEAIRDFVSDQRHDPSQRSFINSVLKAATGIFGAWYSSFAVPAATIIASITVLEKVPDADDPVKQFRENMLSTVSKIAKKNKKNIVDFLQKFKSERLTVSQLAEENPNVIAGDISFVRIRLESSDTTRGHETVSRY